MTKSVFDVVDRQPGGVRLRDRVSVQNQSRVIKATRHPVNNQVYWPIYLQVNSGVRLGIHQ